MKWASGYFTYEICE